jgi:hypothetical protein
MTLALAIVAGTFHFAGFKRLGAHQCRRRYGLPKIRDYIEPICSRLPLGAQYQVLCRKPA